MSGASTIGALRVVLGLDSAQFTSGLKSSQAQAVAASTALQKTFGNVGDALDSVFSTSRLKLLDEGGLRLNVFGSALEHLGAVGIAAGVAIGAAALAFEGVKKSLEFGDKISDTAAKLAVTTDVLQEYRYAVHALGGEYEDADKALEGFSVAFGAAHAALTKRATRPFEALGLDPKSFADTESALQAVIAKIAALKSTAEQAAIAEKLGLTPMLAAIRAGVAALDDLRAKAEAIGFVLDKDVAARASEANDKFQDLSQVIKVQFAQAFVDAAPAILTVTQAVADLITMLGKLGKIDSFSPQMQNSLVTFGRMLDALKSKGLVDAIVNAPQHGYGFLVQAEAGDARARENALNGGGIKGLYSPVLPVPTAVAPRAGTSLTPPTAKGRNPEQVAEASTAAIAKADKDELQARIALTGNIAELATLRAKEVTDETAAANTRLQLDAKQGKITQAAADKATALNDQAALEKKALITRQAAFDAQNAELAQRETLEGYAQQSAQIEASLAQTAAARNAIEAKALTDQQALDRDKLATDTDQKVLSGKLTVLKGLELIDAQKSHQLEQTRAQSVAALSAVQKEQAERAEATLQLQIDLLSSQADAATTQSSRNQIGDRILELEQQLERQKLEEIVASATASKTEQQIAAARLKQLPTIEANQIIAKHQADFDRAISDATSATEGFAEAIQNGDFPGLFNAFAQALKSFGGGSTAIADLSNSFSAAAFVYKGGSALGSALAKLIGGNQKVGGQVGGIVGGIPGALASLLGGKPSNNAAISTLTGTSFSIGGDKRTDDTTTLATNASNAILQGEKLLTDAGIQLGATVKSIDIGVRDSTHILLSTGQTIQSAVGDAAAAAEAGLRAVLQNATYTSDAEKQLVDAMLAAGKGFDEISAALQSFDAAQLLGSGISDAIQKLVDPQAYDVAQLKSVQAARAAQVQAAADAGYLTAQQLTDINAQLERLDGIELDQVLQKYADAADRAADDLVSNAKSATSAATQALDAARDAAAQPLQATITQFQALADSLTAFGATLADADLATRVSYGQASALERSTADRARLGDPAALGALQAAGTQFLTASKASAHTLQEFLRDQSRVKLDVAAAAATAGRQVTIAQQQLDALNAQVATAEGTTAAVVDVGTAIANLAVAQAAEAAAVKAALDRVGSLGNLAPITIPPPNLGDTSMLAGPSTGGVNVGDLSGGNQAIIDQLASLRIEQQAANIQLAKNTGEVARILRYVSPDGDSLLIQVA